MFESMGINYFLISRCESIIKEKTSLFFLKTRMFKQQLTKNIMCLF